MIVVRDVRCQENRNMKSYDTGILQWDTVWLFQFEDVKNFTVNPLTPIVAIWVQL